MIQILRLLIYFSAITSYHMYILYYIYNKVAKKANSANSNKCPELET